MNFDDLYRAVNADLAVTSVGTNNGTYRHPFRDHLAAARREGNCRLLCTQLTERCHDDPLTLRDDAVRQASGVEYPYRHRAAFGHERHRPEREVPCAGSVVAWIDARGQFYVEPASNGEHQRLLDKLDHPVCQD